MRSIVTLVGFATLAIAQQNEALIAKTSTTIKANHSPSLGLGIRGGSDKEKQSKVINR